MPAAQGRALTIGLNAVGKAFSGWPQLTTPERNASDVAAIAQSRGFVTKTLLANRATRRAVIAAITTAAAALRKGDIFLLSFSGHGDQVPDRNREETDIKDAHPWAQGVMDSIVAKFQATTGRYPHVPPASEDPYEPPNRD